MVEVTLTWYEAFEAAQAGAMRRIEALKRGRRDRWGGNPLDKWGCDVESCAAEKAYAKATNQYWWSSGAANLDTLPGDVGRDQVRWTPRPDGKLIIHDDDPDEAIFVLVRGIIPTFTIVGWIHGIEAKTPLYWVTSTGRPAFFVPESALTLGLPRS